MSDQSDDHDNHLDTLQQSSEDLKLKDSPNPYNSENGYGQETASDIEIITMEEARHDPETQGVASSRRRRQMNHFPQRSIPSRQHCHRSESIDSLTLH